jgi:hypothetical protein
MNYHALCFVDMPFGQKPDLKSEVVVDFDQIYREAIKPAIESCDLEVLRWDEECTGDHPRRDVRATAAGRTAHDPGGWTRSLE